MINHPFVGIAGNIGVGKTTFTDIVAKHFGWKPYYESVADNPYLDDFYRDMQRWSLIYKSISYIIVFLIR